MEKLDKKFTLLANNVVLLDDLVTGQKHYMTRLSAANTLAQLFLYEGGDDGQYYIDTDDICVIDGENVNSTAFAILVTIMHDNDTPEGKTLQLIICCGFGTFVSEWY